MWGWLRPCFIACIGNEIFWRTRCAETPKTEFLRFPCTETPVVEFLRFPSRAQRYSTVSYREWGYLAHPVRRNSKNGVSEVPMRRNSGSGVFEIPVRSDTPPYLIENEVFWRTPCAETPKTEFLRIPCAIIPLLDDMWRGRRWSTSGTCIGPIHADWWNWVYFSTNFRKKIHVYTSFCTE